MQKFEFLRQPLLGELAMSRKKKKKEKKMPFVVATYVYASSQGQRTHSARTNKYRLWLASLPGLRTIDSPISLPLTCMKNFRTQVGEGKFK